MQILTNTTGMEAGLAVGCDAEGRDYLIVAIKGTFVTDESGRLSLHATQRPLTFADEHYGSPEATSVRYECDFALEKQRTDVIVVGKAVAPGGQPVEELAVRLQVGAQAKDIMVRGERRWTSSWSGVVAGDPVPFVEMPLTFDRAWGGADASRGPSRTAYEARNPVGVGYRPHATSRELDGLALPNLERVGDRVSSPSGRHEPIGFGCVGRSWQPRVGLAGTYDARWRDERAPFLPRDFDVGYYQCAPDDQQFPLFTGNEVIRCVHMAEAAVVRYVMPHREVVVRIALVDRELAEPARLDTVILEPHLGLAMLVWRAKFPLPKKLALVRGVHLGEGPCSEPSGERRGKPFFQGLAAALAWLAEQRRRR